MHFYELQQYVIRLSNDRDPSICYLRSGSRYPRTSNPIVKIHWWYDTGVAVRYRPVYTVDRADCTITGGPEVHALDTSVEPYSILREQPAPVIVHATDHVHG